MDSYWHAAPWLALPWSRCFCLARRSPSYCFTDRFSCVVVVLGAQGVFYLSSALPSPRSASAMEFLGLSFSPGLKLQEEVRFKLGALVSHPVVDRSSFALVAAFGRCKFKLSPSSFGLLLQAAIGDVAIHFNVS